MGRIPRTYSESGIYHIYFRTVNEQNIFEEKKDYTYFKEIIKNLKSEMNFEIYAYCLMSNHVHIVLKENREKDISLIMKRLLSKYVRWYNIKYERNGALIANRYKSSPVESDEYLLHLIRYIHQNPVKAGIVKKPEKYAYSSYDEYNKISDIVDTHFIYSMIDEDEFKTFNEDVEDLVFTVTDGVRKTDEELILHIRKKYGIKNPKEISKLKKNERDNILYELKNENYAVRHLQRITGVSRGVINKAGNEKEINVPVWLL